MAPMCETCFLWLVHLCEVCENCSIWLSNDWNNFYKTTDHLQQFRADKMSTFSKAKPLLSPQLILLNSFNFDQKHCNISKGFHAIFVYCIWLTNPFFFGFLYSCVPLFHFFSFRLSIMCHRVFNKTIILLGLAEYEMIITYSALRTSLIIYHFISSMPS